MPFDGSTWNESLPTNSDLANELDDYMRDDKTGVRGRMAHEHTWPSSQTGTNEGGWHAFITFKGMTAAPALIYGTTTQVGAVYVSTDKHLMFEDSAGTTFMMAKSAVGSVFFSGTGTIGHMPYITSGGGFAQLAVTTTNFVLAANGATTAGSFKALSSIVVVTSGQAAHGATVSLPSGVNSNEVQAIMVAIGDCSAAEGTSNTDGIYTVCSVDANRVVTARWDGVNVGGGSGVATANYMLVAVVTH